MVGKIVHIRNDDNHSRSASYQSDFEFDSMTAYHDLTETLGVGGISCLRFGKSRLEVAEVFKIHIAVTVEVDTATSHRQHATRTGQAAR